MSKPSGTIEPTAPPAAGPGAGPPAPGEAPEQVSATVRVLIIVAILVPLLAVLSAPVLAWGWGFTWTDLGLLLSLYALSGLGITVGFHRLFVHRSFETTVVVEFVLAVLGSMAVQGSLFRWVAQHRRHHRHADSPGDPHSPHSHYGGATGVVRGFWYAHIGWFFDADPPGRERYVADLSQSRALRAADALFPAWVALGLIVPTALGGLVAGSWWGAATGVFWGGLVRIFLVHHITWSVNSACHLWGRRPYRTDDESRNNALFGVLAWGEGWHNTHHAFPTSARHGLSWWQIDVSYWVIWVLARLGLAWNVKIPSIKARRNLERDADRLTDKPFSAPDARQSVAQGVSPG